MFLFKRKTDSKGKLLERQNFLLTINGTGDLPGHEQSDELFMSKEDMRRYTDSDVSLYLRIIDDCKRAISETVLTDVFFSRYDLLVKRADQLRSYEPYTDFKGETPTQIYNQSIREKQQRVRDFILRSSEDAMKKADAMKTPKGKIGKWNRWRESFVPYHASMDDENIRLIDSTYACAVNQIEGIVP